MPEQSFGEKVEEFVGGVAEKIFGDPANYNKTPNPLPSINYGDIEQRPVPTMNTLPVSPVRVGSGVEGTTAIDTNVLTYFADVVEQLLPNIEKALAEIQQVDVRPGNFMHADAIIQKIEGGGEGGGLKQQYTESLTKMRDGCMLIVRRFQEMAKRYETTDELNKQGAEELSNIINEVNGYLPSVGPPGAAPPGTPPPGAAPPPGAPPPSGNTNK